MPTSFITPLKVEVLDYGINYRVLEAFVYYREDDANSIIPVPKDFITDFASIPRLFWNILPPMGHGKRKNYGKSAVLHDFLYDKECKFNYTRKQCDQIFREAMKASGCSWLVRNVIYWCVRLFASGHFRKD